MSDLINFSLNLRYGVISDWIVIPVQASFLFTCSHSLNIISCYDISFVIKWYLKLQNLFNILKQFSSLIFFILFLYLKFNLHVIWITNTPVIFITDLEENLHLNICFTFNVYFQEQCQSKAKVSCMLEMID